MSGKSETFSKSERLCSKKVIEALFENGKTIYCAPLLIVWSYHESDSFYPAQVAFSVPKKVFRLAGSRNLIKRRLREAYRKNKMILYNYLRERDKKIVFTIIYREKTIYDYFEVEIAIKQMIGKLVKTLDESK